MHMQKTEELRRQAAPLWTARDLTQMFKVTPMTITNWRVRPPYEPLTAAERDENRRRAENGDPPLPRRPRNPLPAVEIPGNGRIALRFVPEDVRTWARRAGLVMHNQVERA
jgi:hypothetical protein